MSMSDIPAVTTVFVNHRATGRELKRTRLKLTSTETGPAAELLIEQPRVTVGRSSICDMRVNDPAVSGTHFEIVADERGFLLRDLQSTNGTFCGDLRIKEVWLKPGTNIRVGKSIFRFEEGEGTVTIDISSKEGFEGMIGRSVGMREVFAVLEKAGPTDLTVLVNGETGTGKELVARAVHRASNRASAPFVVQDCSAIPKTLIESTLFGHEKGAFTGASQAQPGCFEQANGGTIFLDEIGELDISLQPKLLRVLENREVKRVGGTKTIPVDLRVVAATNRDLREMVNEGTFREDLYFRLSVVRVHLPPLHDRADDIPLLVRHMMTGLESLYPEAAEKKISKEGMQKLQRYEWPGNVRELRNVIERAVVLGTGPMIGVEELSPAFRDGSSLSDAVGADRFIEQGLSFKEAKQQVLDQFEKQYIKGMLEAHAGNISRSAETAGITRYHLRELAKRHGVRDAGDAGTGSGSGSGSGSRGSKK